MSKIFALTLTLSMMWAGVANAATYYVATTGSDLGGNGTIQKPWKTIGYGISKLAGGDSLIVKKGTYYGKENFINSRLTAIPSGSAGAYTAIKAEVPMEVRIENSSTLGYRDNEILLDGSYVHVDGFVFNLSNSAYPPHNAAIYGNYNKVTRSIFRRAGTIDPYGGWLYVGGSYNLVEDSAGVGAARYGFEVGGPESTASYNILRRVVGRLDYSNSKEPKSTFVHYGNNSGPGNSHHNVFQNCIALDSQQPDYHGYIYGYKNGGIKVNKYASNDIIAGSIVLNEELEYYGLLFQGKDHSVLDTVVWDGRIGLYGNVRPVGFRDESTGSVATRLTIGKNTGGSVTGATPIDSSIEPSDARYLVMPNTGATKGATILKRIGRSGTLYGQLGWNDVTEEDLWPWAYEGKIKEVFSEPNNPPSGSTPPTNNTVRGFTASADAFGKPMTLTRYVWQYLGNPIPDSIYRLPPAPENIAAKVLK